MIKVSLMKVLDKILGGVRRFWPCHLCTVLAAILFGLDNHDWTDDSAMLNAMWWGICWGALAGVFARLVCEWRGISKGNLVSGIVTVVVFVSAGSSRATVLKASFTVVTPTLPLSFAVQ